MRDADIRAILKSEHWLQSSFDGDSVVYEEFGVLNGKNRADIVVVNGELWGFEIKAPCDSLVRLHGQASSYGRVFDRLVLVTTDKHVDAASELVPDFWGIAIVGEQGALSYLREPRRNSTVDLECVVRLLWRAETLALCEKYAAPSKLLTKPRRILWSWLVASVPSEDLKKEVRHALKLRKTGYLLARKRQMMTSSNTTPHLG